MSQNIVETAEAAIAATYKRLPLVITRGSGSRLWDENGKEYIDFFAGIAVCNLGHAHPRVADAVCDQARRLCHVSNLFYTVPQTELAAWLVARSFADRVFFCNSGAEANEAAIKLVRKYFNDRGAPDRYRIVAMKQSFHGRTMAALSATGQDKIRHGIAPVLDGFDFVPFDDIDALAKAVTPKTCAVMLEPIQGEGGIRVPSPGYLEAVRALCDERGCLLVFDEVQTGIGRTGSLFAYEQFNVWPDVMTLAKALANGFPIGAMLTTEKFAAAFGPGAHASTFGGTPVITAAALETMKIIESDGILDRCRETGAYLMGRLQALGKKHAVISEVRGRGLLIGAELTIDAGPVTAACMDAGFLINTVQGNILRFAPPLIITKAEIDAMIECLDRVLSDSAD